MPVPPDPEALAALQRHALEVLQPGEGKHLVIVEMSDEELEAAGLPEATIIEPEDVSADIQPSNVVSIFGGPAIPGEDLRREQRAATIQALEDLIDMVERGEIREIAVIAGREFNEDRLSEVMTTFSPGVTDHLALFMGGAALLQRHMADAFEDEMIAGEIE